MANVPPVTCANPRYTYRVRRIALPQPLCTCSKTPVAVSTMYDCGWQVYRRLLSSRSSHKHPFCLHFDPLLSSLLPVIPTREESSNSSFVDNMAEGVVLAGTALMASIFPCTSSGFHTVWRTRTYCSSTPTYQTTDGHVFSACPVETRRGCSITGCSIWDRP